MQGARSRSTRAARRISTPSRYAYFHANGFVESGAGGQDLSVGTDNIHSLQPYSEMSLDKAFGNELNPVNMQLRLGYAHEVPDANRAVTVTTRDGTISD